MSRANPDKALAALLPQTITVCDGVSVRPISLAMFAVLERIKSPMLTGSDCDTLEILPTLYALTHDPDAVLAEGNLLDAAVKWADALPIAVIAGIRQASEKQIAAVLDVVPEVKKKATEARTDGSPRSGSGRAKHTAGRRSTSSPARRAD